MWNPCKLLLPIVPALVLSATAAEWGNNYEQALATAKQQGKAVLVDFTGSDWCHFCIRLRADVLDHPAFATWAGQHFVLLEVDMPENPNFDRKLREQNTRLCAQYKVDAYPTLLVLDPAGNPLGGLFGYEADPVTVQKQLAPGLQAHYLLKRARHLQGKQKLQAMLAAWRHIPQELHELNKPLQQELMAIDTQDLSGLRAAAKAEQALQDCKAAEATAPTDAAALEIVNTALARAVPQNRRQLLELKYRLLIRAVETPEDVYAAADVAYAIIDADLRLTPEVKESRKRQLRGVFANPQTSINRSKMLYRKRPKK